MRKPGHSISSEIKSEFHKMKDMSFIEKISYIWTYYKHVFAIFLILCLVGFYMGDVIVQASKETVLVGFFPNDEWNLFNSSLLEKEFSDYLQLDSDHNVYFEDNLYIDLNGDATEYTEVSASMIMAYQANIDLDFIAGPEYLFEYYNGALPMYDFHDLLPEDLAAELEDYFVYIDPADGVQNDEEADAEEDEEVVCGEYGAYGLDLTACRYVTGVGADENPEIEDTYILFVPQTAPRTETVVEYIRFLFDWQ